jgi:chromosomal replication initiator protein
LTSDKGSVDMQDIEQRLLSRFKWGLSAELHQPDYETRVSILKIFCIVMVLKYLKK